MMFENPKTNRRAAVLFRPFRQEDGDSFRRCIEDFYGDGYPYKDYLDPAFLADQCLKGNMVILCGTTEDNEVISCSAVEFHRDFASSAKLLLRVVKKEFRGMGIGSAQEKLLLEALKQRPALQSVYADVMTHDAVSQSSLAGEDFVLCGLRLMLYFNSIMVPKLPFPPHSKMTQAVMCRREEMRQTGSIFCPPEHRQMVTSIYDRLGVSCQLEDNSPPPLDNTRYTWDHKPMHRAWVAKVQDASADFDKLAAQWAEITKETEYTTGLCYLNLKGHGAAAAYGALRQAGFFFTGLKPLNEDGEYMLLSHIGKQPLCRDTIALHNDESGLFDYILRDKER